MVTTLREPSIPVTELERSAFCRADDDLASRTLEEELTASVRWQRIPAGYLRVSPQELDARIARARAALGERLVILGHHYQREEVIRHADLRGDSFRLSQFAADQAKAEHIVFCGVHFMAETARVLCAPHQTVILPNLTAGCSMADMAPADDVLDCWGDLVGLLGKGGIVPVTYMNSVAAIKALCGREGGAVCTSSNAPAVFRWGFSQAPRLLFLPDQHLGRNTALGLGLAADDMVVWDPFKPLGGNTEDEVRRARVVLWRGHCSVHTRFTAAQIAAARRRYPAARIVVHPECTADVVQAADCSGSTEYIIKAISASAPGTVWGVGTEISLVSRIARENPDKTVFCLDSMVCPCSTMYRIHPAYLAWVLESLTEGRAVNQITVDDETRRQARVALDRMLSIV